MLQTIQPSQKRKKYVPLWKQYLLKQETSNAPKVKDSDRWATPQILFDAINNRFQFTLDVAAEEKTAKCQRYLTAKEDALRQFWKDEICWCNPPYSKPLPWVQKAIHESRYNNATIVMLLKDDATTKTYKEALKHCSEVIRITRRVPFEHPDHVVHYGVSQWTSVLFIFRPNHCGEPKHIYWDWKSSEPIANTPYQYGR